jgi:alkylated DNA nucleotide flippase Atl1
MASTRAEEVAELLWELKRASKLAKYSVIAKRAGFSAGANGKAMETALKTVRRDWPHLQWWRAVNDTLQVEKDSEQAKKLAEASVGLKPGKDNKDNTVTLATPDELLMEWPEQPVPTEVVPAAAAK